MALLVFGSPLVSCRGTIGGHVFTSDNSGSHVVTRTHRVNKYDPARNARNRAFLIASQWWSKFPVLQIHRPEWNLYATYPETGYMAFIRVNWLRVFNGLSILAKPPD